MSRFNLHQNVYWGLDNSLVNITNVNTNKTSHNIPVYDFTHQDGKTYRDMENNLFHNIVKSFLRMSIEF